MLVALLSIAAAIVVANAGLYAYRRRFAPLEPMCDDDEEPLPLAVTAAGFLAECGASACAATLALAGPALPRRYGDHERAPRLILLHGLGQTRGVVTVLARRLAARGYAVACFPAPPWALAVPELAESLHRFIGELQLERQGPLHLVGFGLGGLVARYCVRRHSVPGVRRVITLGTAHRGTMLAPPWPLALAQLRPDSPFLAHLNAADRAPQQFESTAIQSEFDATVLPADNGYYPAAFNVTVRDTGHFALLFSRRIFELIVENLQDGA